MHMHVFPLKLSFLALLLLPLAGYCQPIHLAEYQTSLLTRGISLFHLNADSLFGVKQNIFITELKREEHPGYSIGLAYSDSTLKGTSRFGRENKALVALNGSFFDVEKGGSVAYLESEGKTHARNRKVGDKWAKTDSLLNGAIVIGKNGKLKIEKARTEAYYEKSNKEKSVLVSGPLLLRKGRSVPLENSEFVKKRHPRSCLCKTKEAHILFIAIDGRSELASGMNLKELQHFLVRLNCKDAINLDGGGSTTLWINDGNDSRIVNKPSDKEGERPVANILMIQKVD